MKYKLKFHCEMFEPSLSCSCNWTQYGNGTHCYDIDECENQSHQCHPNAECINRYCFTIIV